MFGIGFQEMLIILVVVLIFFGPKRLPDLAKSLGKGIAEFKKASEEVRKGIEDAVKEESVAEAPKPQEDFSSYGKAPGSAPAAEETPKAGPGPDPIPEGISPTSADGTAPVAAPKDPVPPRAETTAADAPVPPPRQG